MTEIIYQCPYMQNVNIVDGKITFTCQSMKNVAETKFLEGMIPSDPLCPPDIKRHEDGLRICYQVQK